MDDPARFDLRLLMTVEAIQRLGSLTAAGEALGLSQPAISHSLNRLRIAFNDELFVRTSRGMRPTSRANEIAASARRVMTLMRSELGTTTPFAPGSMRRVFTLCMSDVGEMVFLPRLVQRLRQEAPGCDVATVSMAPRTLAAALEDGSVDLAVGYFPDLGGAGLAESALFERGFLCLAAADHPRLRAGRLPLDVFLSESHVVVTSEGRTEERFDRFLKEKRLTRRVLVSLPHMLAVPMIVASSDLIATVPYSAAVQFARYPGIRLYAPPVEPPRIPVAQYWSERFANDPARQWLRGLIAEISGSVTEEVAIPRPRQVAKPRRRGPPAKSGKRRARS